MSRWNAVVTLVTVDVEPDECGIPREVERSTRDVFANTLRVGLESWAAARSVGLHADAKVQVHTCAYADETRARMGGVEYEVESALSNGDYTTLVLKRRLANG